MKTLRKSNLTNYEHRFVRGISPSSGRAVHFIINKCVMMRLRKRAHMAHPMRCISNRTAASRIRNKANIWPPGGDDRAPREGPGTITASVCPEESWILSEFGGHPATGPEARTPNRSERPSAEMSEDRVNRFESARRIAGAKSPAVRAPGGVRLAILPIPRVPDVVVPVLPYMHPASSAKGSSGSRSKSSLICASPPGAGRTRGVPFSPAGPRRRRNPLRDILICGRRWLSPADSIGEKSVHVNVHLVQGIH